MFIHLKVFIDLCADDSHLFNKKYFKTDYTLELHDDEIATSEKWLFLVS